MSMDLNPINNREIEREFVLEQKSSNSDDFSVRIRNFMAPTINSFLHADNATISHALLSASHNTFLGLLGMNAILAAVDNTLTRDPNDNTSLMSSPYVWGLNVSVIAAMYAVQYGASHYLEASMRNLEPLGLVPIGQEPIDDSIKMENLPTNNGKLREDIYKVALESGIMPNNFIDPISKETIETPVAFEGDTTATIYDLKIVNQLKEQMVVYNPLRQDQRLDFNKLVYLPEVKNQIDAIAGITDQVRAENNNYGEDDSGNVDLEEKNKIDEL